MRAVDTRATISRDKMPHQEERGLWSECLGRQVNVNKMNANTDSIQNMIKCWQIYRLSYSEIGMAIFYLDCKGEVLVIFKMSEAHCSCTKL